MGCLLKEALATQPDISYAVAALSHYTLHPFTSHMTTAKSVLQNCKSTANFCLPFNGNSIGIDIANSLVGCSDSDWANDSVDSKPQLGDVFLARNRAMAWESGNQCLLMMPTLEVDFVMCLETSVKLNGYFNYRMTFTTKTHHHCQSTTTISILSHGSPSEALHFELCISKFPITTVEICIGDT